MRKKTLILMVNIMLFSVFVSAQSHDENWYYLEAERAINKENYEYAIAILNEGKTLFPHSFRITERIGDLYFDKDLYSLALESYKDGELVEPENGSIIYKIGSTYARLNENDRAIIYYEKLLEYNDFHRIAVDDLSWLYYKVHRLEESEKILVDEIEESFHRNLAITLGTVYSDMYNYEKSKKYYLLSIEDAINHDAMYFASVALYNLSLLEYSFYNYEKSMEYTEDSLDALDRSSGHLARGEILQLAGRYGEAETEYLKAESMDDTPLSRIALAGLYQKSGYPEKALAYVKDVQNRRDMNWMYYFGTDKDQYAMDLSDPLRRIYKAMAELEKKQLYETPWQWIVGKMKQIQYTILSFYEEQIYKSSARIVGEHNQGKSDLNSWWAYSRAALGNEPTFMKYITLCEDFEHKLTLKSVPWYLLEKGRESSDTQMLNEALSLFSRDWELEQIMETLVSLIHLDRGKNPSLRRDHLNHLYSLNKGALLQYGFALPLLLEHNGAGSERKLKHYLERTGSSVSLTAEEGYVYKLIVSINEGEYSWYLLDSMGEIDSAGNGVFVTLNSRTYRELVMSITDSIYRYHF